MTIWSATAAGDAAAVSIAAADVELLPSSALTVQVTATSNAALSTTVEAVRSSTARRRRSARCACATPSRTTAGPTRRRRRRGAPSACPTARPRSRWRGRRATTSRAWRRARCGSSTTPRATLASGSRSAGRRSSLSKVPAGKRQSSPKQPYHLGSRRLSRSVAHFAAFDTQAGVLRWGSPPSRCSRAAASAASYQSGVANYFVGRACSGAGLCNETVPSLGVMQVSRGRPAAPRTSPRPTQTRPTASCRIPPRSWATGRDSPPPAAPPAAASAATSARRLRLAARPRRLRV